MSAKVIDIREWREREEKKRQDEANRMIYRIIFDNIKHLQQPASQRPEETK